MIDVRPQAPRNLNSSLQPRVHGWMATAYPCRRGPNRRESTRRVVVLAVLGPDYSEGFVFQQMTLHSVFDCYCFIDRPSVRTSAPSNIVEGYQQPKFIPRYLRPFVQRRLINRKPKRGLQSFPVPHGLGGWPAFERNSPSVGTAHMRFRDDTHGPAQRAGSCTFAVCALQTVPRCDVCAVAGTSSFSENSETSYNNPRSSDDESTEGENHVMNESIHF